MCLNHDQINQNSSERLISRGHEEFPEFLKSTKVKLFASIQIHPENSLMYISKHYAAYARGPLTLGEPKKKVYYRELMEKFEGAKWFYLTLFRGN